MVLAHQQLSLNIQIVHCHMSDHLRISGNVGKK